MSDTSNAAANSAPTENPIENMSFEQALGELETIVRGLEAGETELEKSITAYERGIALKKHCEAKLKEAEEKVAQITLDADGRPTGSRDIEGL